ncbi:MAG: peptide deformylase [Bacteroidia bacterium]|nr:peptide deformylase [Bacteroidia bacterium]
MILPIFAIGQDVLREKTQPIKPGNPQLEALIANMYETMYHAKGVGLAAPQVGYSLQIFVVDGTPMDGILEEEESSLKGWKMVFINPKILSETGEEWAFEEGCLSIPDIREEVFRKPRVKIKYFDRDFVEHVDEFSGMKARIIQHEYDHLQGVLFTDYLKGFKKKLIKSRLSKISKGKIQPTYPMKFQD